MYGINILTSDFCQGHGLGQKGGPSQSCDCGLFILRESLLPQTDPCDAEVQHMLNIPYRIIW